MTAITPEGTDQTVPVSSPNDTRSVGYALLVSTIVHVVVVLVLSLIAFTVAGDNSPQLIMLFQAPGEGESEETLSETPEIEIDVPDAADAAPVVVETDVPISQTAFELSDNVVDSLSGAPTSAAETGSAGRGESAEARAIQGRVQKAGGRKGEIQFALTWQDRNDLDLHVITPAGERISFDHKRSQCKGELDVDMNVHGESETPVENVRWLQRRPPVGRYTVLVNLYRVHDPSFSGRRRTAYKLLAAVGPDTSVIEDYVGRTKYVSVHRFIYIPSSVKGSQRQTLIRRYEQMQQNEEPKAQQMLQQALANTGKQRQDGLWALIRRYPHSDAAITALQKLTGSSGK